MDHDPERISDAIVGIFARRRAAEACVRSLHDAGFDVDQVGFAGSGVLGGTGGVAAALEAVGLAPRLAASYEDQVRGGHFLVTVHGHRLEEAARIVAAADAQVEGPISRGVSQLIDTVPAFVDPVVEGVFNTQAVAETFARQLRAAFPDRLVVVEAVDAPVEVLGSAKERRRRARVIVKGR